MKYVEIRASSDPYFPVYRQNRIRIFPYIVDFVHRRGNMEAILHIDSSKQGFSYETQDSVVKPGFQLLNQSFNRFAH